MARDEGTPAGRRLRLFGPVTAETPDGREIALGGARQRAVFAMLALRPGRGVQVDSLIDAVWGESPPPTVHNALQVYISSLRRAIEPIGLRLGRVGQSYTLNCDVRDVDVLFFTQLAAAGRAGLRSGDAVGALVHFDSALDLATAPLLAGLGSTQILDRARRAAETEVLAVRQDRVLALYGAGEPARAVGEAEALVAEFPYDETCWSRLMSSLYYAGRHAEALDTFQRARATLARELGLEPSPGLVALQAAILRHDLPEVASAARDASGAPAEPPAERKPDLGADRPRAHPFARIGRVELAGRIRTLLDRSRLVTLHGLGGVGKSALALAVADEVADAGRAVAFADLVTAADERGAASVICRALGVEPGDDGWAALAEADPAVLVVADNVEVVDRLAHELDRLLQRSKRLSFLLTSRVPLGVAGEAGVAVGPLPVASTGEGTPPAQELFARLAEQARPGIDLTGAADDVDELCRLAGGLPIALDLIAAKVRTTSPKRLVEQLTRQPASLQNLGKREASGRLRTLGSIVAWAASRCSGEALALLDVLSLVRGPVTGRLIDALAEAPEPLEELLDAGLVTGPDRRDRYTVLPPVPDALVRPAERQAAIDRLVGVLIESAEGNHRWTASELADDEAAVIGAGVACIDRGDVESFARLCCAQN